MNEYEVILEGIFRKTIKVKASSEEEAIKAAKSEPVSKSDLTIDSVSITKA